MSNDYIVNINNVYGAGDTYFDIDLRGYKKNDAEKYKVYLDYLNFTIPNIAIGVDFETYNNISLKIENMGDSQNIFKNGNKDNIINFSTNFEDITTLLSVRVYFNLNTSLYIGDYSNPFNKIRISFLNNSGVVITGNTLTSNIILRYVKHLRP